MGKGSKGGGGGRAVTPQVPQGLKDESRDLGNIGAYEASFLNEPLSLGNWAMNLATGGWGPQVQSPGAGPTQFAGTGSQYTMNANPVMTFSGGAGQPGDAGTPLSSGYQWNGTTGSWEPAQGGGGGGAAQGAGPNKASAPPNPLDPNQQAGFNEWFRANKGKQIQINGQTFNISSEHDRQAIVTALRNQAMNPSSKAGSLLDTFNQSIGAMERTASNPYPGTDPQSIANFQKQLTQDVGMFGPNGLTSEQNAMVDAKTNAGVQNLRTNLANMGVNPNSTQAAELEAELQQQGAAEKGSLIDQNMQVKQGFEKLVMGEQTFSAAEQQAMFSQFQQIGAMTAAEQAQLFQQGLQGYGLMSTFMNAVTQPYQLSLQGFEAELQASEAFTAAQAGITESAMSAAGQSSGAMFGALGSFLGSDAGSGLVSSLVSGIGGVLSAF